MEPHLAAHVWHAKAVAVAADTFHHALHQMRGLGVRGQAERQGIHRRDRPRAHREDVAQDAADAGRGALMRFDIGGVVVALHLEDDRLIVADIDDARIFARPADHLWPRGRQGAQPFLRALVGTMLVPHRREDAKLRETRRTPDDLQDARVFVGLQPVGADQILGDRWFLHHFPRARGDCGVF